jgi:hypothetical protein
MLKFILVAILLVRVAYRELGLKNQRRQMLISQPDTGETSTCNFGFTKDTINLLKEVQGHLTTHQQEKLQSSSDSTSTQHASSLADLKSELDDIKRRFNITQLAFDKLFFSVHVPFAIKLEKQLAKLDTRLSSDIRLKKQIADIQERLHKMHQEQGPEELRRLVDQLCVRQLTLELRVQRRRAATGPEMDAARVKRYRATVGDGGESPPY